MRDRGGERYGLSWESVQRCGIGRGSDEEALSEQRVLTTSGPAKQYTEYCFIRKSISSE